jgi:hypothetical protein
MIRNEGNGGTRGIGGERTGPQIPGSVYAPGVADESPDAGERYFFVHLQKTAGTSLLIRLGHQFRPEQIYPDATDGDLFGVMPQLEPSQLVARWRARGDEIRVVTGHFPLCTAELLDAPFRTFTVLREPVERTLSYLRHHRRMTPEDTEVPLEEIYEDPLRFTGLIHNHMVKMFSLRLDEMTGGSMTPVDFTPEHLTRAKERLAGVDVVGLQERFDDFVAELERRFGWDLGPPLVANDTVPVPVDPAFRDRIAADNALDVELYAWACDLVASRMTTD